jgi:formylglycine-generating enzyme required for sulfatase activity/tRNA A-37 threonylcarbamoyl transferase component Bud32
VAAVVSVDSTRADAAPGASEVLARGEALGRYIVIERLGEGATGFVYAAYDPELDRKVAIKILRRRDEGAQESRRQARFVREAKSIAKLAHPNVVGIFDVGVHEGRAFLAMEYVEGGTLRQWMESRRRPWRDVVKMFVAVGRGLTDAHAAGLVHRDFKPDNVLIDPAGTPKVADFGLARLSGSGDADSSDGLDKAETIHEVPAVPLDSPLTRTGAIAGTPAYMAPEQFMGRATDGRTDQFAFCVALHEALYGRRPFDEESVFELADSVIRERIQTPPNAGNVPSWIRRSLLRGLKADPNQRYATLEDLLGALQADPVARLRKVVVASIVTVLVVGTLAGLYRRSERRRLEFEGRVASKLNEGQLALTDARALDAKLLEARGRAFAAFDGGQHDDGELAWREARADASKLDSTLKRAQAVLEAALALDPSNEHAHDALADALFERASLAELEHRKADLSRHLELMGRIDVGGRLKARWGSPGIVELALTPDGASGATLVIERFEPSGEQAGDLIVSAPVGEPFVGKGLRTLAPGSYRVTATLPGFAPTRLPFVVHRGEQLRLELPMLAAREVPPDFVFVPAGRFLYGDADEDLRVGFLNAAPLHERSTSGYLIKAHETTFGDWLEFLRDLPASERKLRTPASTVVQGSVIVAGSAESGWSLALNIAGLKVTAGEGSPIIYPSRRAHTSQDWLKMPVLGVSQTDMQAYVAWLSRTGRVRGARFCTELEWERAARGADDRLFPASDVSVSSEDANIDLTYGHVPGSVGPDEVGNHPRSASPFGIHDLAGNAWEVVRAADDVNRYVIRGGSYYHAFVDGRATNREPAETNMRSYVVGLRVCAAEK